MLRETLTYSIDEVLLALIQSKDKMGFSIPIIKRLFESYINNSLLGVEKLLDAVEKNDNQLIKEKAHALRGTSLTLQLNKIAECCYSIEYGEEGLSDEDYAKLAKETGELVISIFNQKEMIIERLDTLND